VDIGADAKLCFDKMGNEKKEAWLNLSGIENLTGLQSNLDSRCKTLRLRVPIS
jgi:hypothetical protein